MLNSYIDKYPVCGELEISEIDDKYQSSKQPCKINIKTQRSQFVERLLKRKNDLLTKAVTNIYPGNNLFVTDPEFKNEKHQIKIKVLDTSKGSIEIEYLDPAVNVHNDTVDLILKCEEDLFNKNIPVLNANRNVSIYNLMKMGKGCKVKIDVICKCTVVSKQLKLTGLDDCPVKELIVTFSTKMRQVVHPGENMKIQFGMGMPDDIIRETVNYDKIVLSDRYVKSSTIANNILNIMEKKSSVDGISTQTDSAVKSTISSSRYGSTSAHKKYIKK